MRERRHAVGRRWREEGRREAFFFCLPLLQPASPFPAPPAKAAGRFLLHVQCVQVCAGDGSVQENQEAMQ